MASRRIVGVLVLALAALLGVALYSPQPHHGVFGTCIPILLYLLFGPLSILAPFFVGYLSVCCFLPLSRETCVALAFVVWCSFLLAVAWLASGVVGEGMAGMLRTFFGASHPALAGVSVLIMGALFGPASRCRARRRRRLPPAYDSARSVMSQATGSVAWAGLIASAVVLAVLRDYRAFADPFAGCRGFCLHRKSCGLYDKAHAVHDPRYAANRSGRRSRSSTFGAF